MSTDHLDTRPASRTDLTPLDHLKALLTALADALEAVERAQVGTESVVAWRDLAHPLDAEPKRLTIAQFCKELDIAQSTFHDWRAKGKAPKCIRLPNGRIVIRRVDFDCWLESLEIA